MKLEGEAELQREIEKLAKRAGLMNGKFADYAAGVAQKTVIRNVQPFGVGKKARESGEKAVAAGINQVFSPVKRRGKGVIDSLSEARRVHQAARGSKGRVSGTRGGKQRIYYPVMMAYIRQAQGQVGRAKGSFSDEARRLGVKPQKWITRHRGGGDAKRRGKKMRVVWQFSSAVEYTSSGYVMGARGINRVLRMQHKNLRRSLEGKLRRMGKKF